MELYFQIKFSEEVIKRDLPCEFQTAEVVKSIEERVNTLSEHLSILDYKIESIGSILQLSHDVSCTIILERF